MTEHTKRSEKKDVVPRPPVVAVMGHIDHGKSTLLDYIRKTNVAENEVGGITQALGAYEVEHKIAEGELRRITFLDTPGHEAFRGIRARGVGVADIAILVVSTEDGVKPQTIEALRYIKEAKLPFIVALTKIDKPTANVERARQSLAEEEVYLEGYGGDIPAVPVSGKTGAGIPELLDLIALIAEMHDILADPKQPAGGVVIETHLDKMRGITATLIVKEGTLRVGAVVAAGDAVAPARYLVDTVGNRIQSAGPGSVVALSGWSAFPPVGSSFETFGKKADAEREISKRRESSRAKAVQKPSGKGKRTETAEGEPPPTHLPLIIKADAAGSVEAIVHQIQKIGTPVFKPKIILAGVGAIGDGDVKLARGGGAVIAGFNVGVEGPAQGLAERDRITLKTFDVIFKLTEWIGEELEKRRPRRKVPTVTGKARVLKIFGGEKGKQIIGCRVLEGAVRSDGELKIVRRGFEIGIARVRELQRQKERVGEVAEGTECGMQVEGRMEIAVGDELHAVTIIEE